MKSKIITIIGVVLTIYGAFLCNFSNFNLGVLLVALLGIGILCAGIFHKRLSRLFSRGFFRICKNLIAIGICLEMGLVAFIAVYGIYDNVDYTEDAVVVLGAGIHGDKVSMPLKLRLDKAVDYHQKNPDSVIVVTGGQGLQETVTEAYAMEKYLLQQGIVQEKIIKEEKATSTFENMKFSKEILDTYFESDYSVVVITNNFHVFRGTAIAKKAGFENVTHTHAGMHWYNLMPCYLRESLAVAKMLIIG